MMLLAGLCLSLLQPVPAAAEIVSYAIVQDDGSLLVSGRTIRLFGIYIPPTDRTCRTFTRPVECGSRAALALDFRVQGFVRCEEVHKNRDGSIAAQCFVRDEGAITSSSEDLAAWMLMNGWAVALPDAPFEYVTLEKIARAQGRGIWGFQVDDIR